MSSEQPPADDTFADVVNGLTLGRRKQRQSTKDNVAAGMLAEAAPIWSEPDPVSQPAARLDWSWMDQEHVPAPSDASIVRPYSWTRGRTKSTVDMRIEALVTTSERGDNLDALTQAEHRSVAELCREPKSVAEIGTLLNVPLGVAKVLVGDMAGLGLVVVHKTATGGANKAHLLLMERVLSGLRRL